MAWVRIDDKFTAHPKVAQLSDREFRTLMRLYCYTAMFETRGVIPQVAHSEVHGFTPKVARRLVEVGLLERGDDGALQIHDWEKYAPPKDRTNAERQRRHRERNGESNALRNGDDTAADNAPVFVPVIETPSAVDLAATEQHRDFTIPDLREVPA